MSTNRIRFFLPALGVVAAPGQGADTVRHTVATGATDGMLLEPGWLKDRPARVGRVPGTMPAVPAALKRHACRNNEILLAAIELIAAPLKKAIDRFGSARVGIVLGTSTSGIAEGELAVAAYRHDGQRPASFDYVQQELGAPAVFLQSYLGLTGPAYAISTACTSSGKAVVSARNLITLGICDAVITGGVDSLCRLTINGFTALESTTPDICNPMSRNRRGINIGEGAAVFLMTRDEAPIELLGAGESSDAHHISAPDPDGQGAERAMRSALADAGMATAEIDYVNLHATATIKNDDMEARAMTRVFPAGVPTSGTKPLTGHALGAASAIELAFCWLALTDPQGRLPPHVWDGDADPALPRLELVTPGATFTRRDRRACMNNSYAFGGSNVSLIIGDAR
jgi:3-oxoacyl-[acyl-carrier-protein] synthase I